jgi:hypothetical protein
VHEILGSVSWFNTSSKHQQYSVAFANHSVRQYSVVYDVSDSGLYLVKMDHCALPCVLFCSVL